MPRGGVPSPPAGESPLPTPQGLVVPGQLTVASDLSYPPQEYLGKGGAPVGFDIDLAQALAVQLRLKLKVINTNVDGILPEFTQKTRSFDMGISAQPGTPGLLAAAATVPYFVAGQAIVISRSDTHRVTSLHSLCGRRVGANRAQSGEDAVKLENERCNAGAIQYAAYDQDADAMRDIASGKLDAFVDDYPVAVYLASQFSGVRVVPHQFDTSVDVMVFPVGDQVLQPLVAKAFDRLRQDGVYRKLLQKWGLQEGELR